MPSADPCPTALANGATPARLPGMLLLAASSALCACAPNLVVGERTCSEDGSATTIPAKTDPVAVSWSTSFENGTCDYTELAGYCYGAPPASLEMVTSPVHSGQFAAAFSVVSADSTGDQKRCFRQGALPQAAYYGAWYWIPALATNTALWNLFHFVGGDPSALLPSLWDVSLSNAPNGELQLFVYDFLNTVNGIKGAVRRPANSPPVPIATWFHIQFYLERAADATGEIRLYQDGQLLLDVTNVITDDSSFGQWYVGNLATGLMPPNSTVYVDDVSIGSTLDWTP